MQKLLKKQGVAPTEWVTDKYQVFGSTLLGRHIQILADL